MGDVMTLMNTAIILAGGKSTRMGFDKQLIRIGDMSITEYIIGRLKPVFKNIIVVTNKPYFYKDKDVVIAEDICKGYGPLGGIHAGLVKSQSMYNYIVACDMPYINIHYIEYMMNRIEESNYDKYAVITRFGEWIEPFNAFYSKKLISYIEENIMENKKKISQLLDRTNVLYINEDIARSYSPDWSMFTNLNTEKDLKNLKHKGKEGLIYEFNKRNHTDKI